MYAATASALKVVGGGSRSPVRFRQPPRPGETRDVRRGRPRGLAQRPASVALGRRTQSGRHALRVAVGGNRERAHAASCAGGSSCASRRAVSATCSCTQGAAYFLPFAVVEFGSLSWASEPSASGLALLVAQSTQPRDACRSPDSDPDPSCAFPLCSFLGCPDRLRYPREACSISARRFANSRGTGLSMHSSSASPLRSSAFHTSPSSAMLALQLGLVDRAERHLEVAGPDRVERRPAAVWTSGHVRSPRSRVDVAADRRHARFGDGRTRPPARRRAPGSLRPSRAERRHPCLEHPHRGLDGPIVSVQDPGRQLSVPGEEQQRDALRDGEDGSNAPISVPDFAPTVSRSRSQVTG